MMNIEQIRKDTPGVPKLIHFNNAGASLVTQQVIDATINFIHEDAITGGYRITNEKATEINNFYTQAAKLINASPNEIALTQNATSSLNLALYSIPFQKGDVIITSELEYGNNFINYLHLKEQKGIEIRIFKHELNGSFDLNAFEKLIDNKVKLIAITHIPTSNGIIAPAEEIGKLAKKYQVLFMVDACQSIGQIPFDVEKIGCDFATATSRKYLRGGRGLGFLYVRQSVIEQLEPVFLELLYTNWQNANDYQLNKSAKMFETWEKPFAAMMGFTAALKYANDLGIDNIWSRIELIANYLREQLQTIEDITVHDIGQKQGGIVTFSKAGISPEDLQKHLQSFNINSSVTARFSSVLEMDKRNISAANRTSVHYYNTKEEVDFLISKLT